MQEIPAQHESLVIVHIRRPEKFTLSIDEIREQIENLFNIKPKQLAMPAEKMAFAIETLLIPIIKMLLEKRTNLKRQVG